MKKLLFAIGIVCLALTFSLGLTGCETDPPPPETTYSTQSAPVALTSGSWSDGYLASESAEVWYSFYAIANTTYYVFWNDAYAGNSSKTADIYVTSHFNDTVLESAMDSAYSTAKTINRNTSGTVKLRVHTRLASTSRTGTFAIGYNTTNTRPTN